MYRLTSLLRAIEELASDSAQMLGHSLRIIFVILLELLSLWLMHSHWVPAEIADRLEPLILLTLTATVVIFCAHTLLSLSLNSYDALQKRMDSKPRKMLIVCMIGAVAGIATFAVNHELSLKTDNGDHTSAVKPFVLDLNVLRGPRAIRPVIPPNALQIDFSFHIPNCHNCSYVGMLDGKGMREVYSQDNFGNFIYRCNRSQLISGHHVFTVLEFSSAGTLTNNKFKFEFEVQM